MEFGFGLVVWVRGTARFIKCRQKKTHNPKGPARFAVAPSTQKKCFFNVKKKKKRSDPPNGNASSIRDAPSTSDSQSDSRLIPTPTNSDDRTIKTKKKFTHKRNRIRSMDIQFTAPTPTIKKKTNKDKSIN